MNKKRLLIIFVKNPELGKCKTRLAATIGDEKALNFYKNMLVRTKEVTVHVNSDKAVYYSSFIDENDLWPNQAPFYKHLQYKNTDLGIKMQSAFEEAFQSGYESVCIIGSDCYALDEKVIKKAFDALENQETVLGPCKDGGYYLLGMNKLYPEFFRNKNWSTETVTPDTIRDFIDLRLNYSLLDELIDIDNEEDLNSLPKEKIIELLSF
ncbi:TIGR04282 family arsenosugar biosynthesis glycosyltransferase [Marivirga salinae]|uniref:TIGR04282 family arsenosugar biosynthesis glycosyltransferase n=1 Tax=Marivirga salinarum TaxID=3059078 RepID=A0AA49GE85_9BACT|nr:TIGR04282 family arsenosugar biosynthesis glycosyltransferase [Marivirga sp. BDSF4-3]WKK75408.2 TIGR04282 family arsenosugar biosynthesis glycosyltransferase [Marivirga sp. BDSF4-3]